jgi:hypothetical protein
MKITIREIINSGEWIITKVERAYNNRVKVSAKRRNHLADSKDFFCDYCSLAYLNKLLFEKYDKRANEMFKIY